MLPEQPQNRTYLQRYEKQTTLTAPGGHFFLFLQKNIDIRKKHTLHNIYLQKTSYLCTAHPCRAVFHATERWQGGELLHINHAFTRFVFGVIEPEKFN